MMEKDGARNEDIAQSCDGENTNTLSNQTECGEEMSSDLGGQTSNELSRQQIEESLTQIIEDINDKRKEDLNIVQAIKKEIMNQAERSCQMIEEHMKTMHDSKGKELDMAIEKLVVSLDKVRSTEEDLESSKMSLQSLFQEIQKTAFQS